VTLRQYIIIIITVDQLLNLCTACADG